MRSRTLLYLLTLSVIMTLFTACSSGTSNSAFDPVTGRHPERWSDAASHGVTVKTTVDGFSTCQDCHGAGFSGGISSVSCFTCHGVNAPHPPKPWRGSGRSHTNTDPSNSAMCISCHKFGANSAVKPVTLAAPGTEPGCFNNTLCHAKPGHPAGWADPVQHGTSAKSASNGFSTCQVCHGTVFDGGVAQTSCFTCHGVTAPHPVKPWRGTTYSHTTTDPGNAPVCASCHADGANSTVKPATPAAAGTAPGCFNNTLCHATVGHPTGWNDPNQHGTSAKSQTNGFSVCQSCHGSTFTGGSTGGSCFVCHGVSAPHSPKPWRGTGRTHTSTDPGNAPVCATCHAGGANSTVMPSTPAAAGTAPGCFNNTLCHATVGHPTGWNDPTQHGVSAKSQADGFSVCQTCHASGFSGGSSGISCFGCHGVNAPHAPAPWRGTIYTHTTTDQGNAPVCAICHANGANSTVKPSTPAPAGTAPGCFNNTLCHATTGHPVGWSASSQHGASAKSQANGFALCQTCHATGFTGGTSGVSCFTCHGVNAPHAPAPWRGTISTHATSDPGNAPVCASCHTGGTNSTVKPSTPAPAGTAPGCFNSTLCHGTIVHPFGWSASSQHGVTAEQNFAACKTCHGATYQGGSAATTCYQCHNGPGLDHPAPAWVVLDHKTAALAGTTVCQKCHGTDYLGGGSQIACKSCHMEDQTKVHMLSWYPDVRTNHRAYALANGTSTCASTYCHGTALTGVALSGPSCSTCHTWPFTTASCGACHGIPPTGTAFPDTAGRHSAHTAVSAAVVCNTCHQGAGSGTVLHQNGVPDVIANATYNAKSGAASFNATANTCSNVSCHGGKVTPSWLTGTINVNTQCTSCHASGTTQYNSYNSGAHTFHIVSRSLACTACHDTTKLAVNHFTTLGTSAMEGPASGTIVTAVNYNGTTCNPSAGGLSGCHSSKTW